MIFNSQNWSRLSELLDKALELPEQQRRLWLETLSDDHADLKPRLSELLANSAQADHFLHKPPDFSVLLAEAHRFPQIDVELQVDKLMGPYRLLRELGQGGMGAVWLAQRIDGKFKREVALKFPYAGPRQRQLTERLIRERDILASLQHANIARLYDADVTASGQPFLVLEYIDGTDINQYCDSHKLDIRQRLTLFQQVLGAVRYAHTHLVIHRDIKPSNILITDDGVAHLLDFGIATSITDGEVHETPLTLFGGYALTPEYASPEQIARITVTTASDVYTLGVVLYELLTGTSPYQCSREQRGQLEEAISNAEITLPSQAAISDTTAAARATQPRQLGKSLRGELDTLLLKALKKNIDERYASADAFYQDINCYLEHQPIHAQPDSQWYRIKKFVRRNRVAVASFAAIAVALLTGTGIALWQAHLAAQQRDRAVALASRSEAVTSFLRLMVTEVAVADEPITMQQLVSRSEEIANRTYAGDSAQQAAILEVLGNYYLSFNRANEANLAFSKALRLIDSMATSQVDSALKAKLYCLSASAQLKLGNSEAARRMLDTGLALSNTAFEVEAMCLSVSASIKYETDDYSGVLQDVKGAEEKLRRSQINDPELAADLIAQAATTYAELGRSVESKRQYQRAIDLLEKAGRGETTLAMQIHGNWAQAYDTSGDPLSAIQHYDKALEIARKRGKVAERDGNFIANRAFALNLLARWDEALAGYQEGIQIAERNGDIESAVSNKQRVAVILLSLGRVADAERAMNEVKPMFGKGLPIEGTMRQTLIAFDGMLAMRRQQYLVAIQKFSENIEFLVAHHMRGGYMASRLKLRGEAYLADKQLAAAFADATEAYAIAKSMQDEQSHSLITGNVELLLSKVYRAQNNLDVSRNWAGLAVTQLQGSLGDNHPTTIEAKQLLDSLSVIH